MKPSMTLKRFTEFQSMSEIADHFRSRLKPGMAIENHGSFWSIAHTIPLAWYDHQNIDDLRRAHSKANLGCDYVNPTESAKTNNEKWIELPSNDQLLLQGKDSWPLSWNGVIPSEEVRKERYKRACSRV